jgi:hypothetical protein
VATTSTLRPRLGARRLIRLPASFSLLTPLHLWHLTSLDAPTVAVVWTLAFAWAVRIHLPLWLPTVLALAAWSAYIGDRLLDARNARTPLRARHHFHWKHRRIFLPIALAAAITGLSLALHSMPAAARERNSLLAAAALIYFTSVHSPWRVSGPKPGLRIPRIPRIPKELLVGVLFTLACATPVLARLWTRSWIRNPDQCLSLLLPILTFTALAWLNCHAIEIWESLTRTHSAKVFRLATALATVAIVFAAVASLHDPRQGALLAAAALSAALLALLDRRQNEISPIALRAAADLVLLVPAALLAIR